MGDDGKWHCCICAAGCKGKERTKAQLKCMPRTRHGLEASPILLEKQKVAYISSVMAWNVLLSGLAASPLHGTAQLQ